jgi:hypothetical protein
MESGSRDREEIVVILEKLAQVPQIVRLSRTEIQRHKLGPLLTFRGNGWDSESGTVLAIVFGYCRVANYFSGAKLSSMYSSTAVRRGWRLLM